MSQLSEILEIEKKRDTAESQCVVNLFQEGTFYRAGNMYFGSGYVNVYTDDRNIGYSVRLVR